MGGIRVYFTDKYGDIIDDITEFPWYLDLRFQRSRTVERTSDHQESTTYLGNVLKKRKKEC
jgi:hypothetical protein